MAVGRAQGKVAILAEDSYGASFVLSLLEKIGLRSRVGYCRRFAGPCNTKSFRQMAAAAQDYERVVILVDGDWNPASVEERILAHLQRLKEGLRAKVSIVVVESEIEEWVCKCLELSLGRGQKPSEVLSQYIQRERGVKYEKWMLPTLARKIDVETLWRLYADDDSFKRFVDAVTGYRGAEREISV